MAWSDWDYIGSAADQVSEQMRKVDIDIPYEDIEAEKPYVAAFYAIYEGQDLSTGNDCSAPWKERCEAMKRVAAALRELPREIQFPMKEALAYDIEFAVSDEEKNNDPDEMPYFMSSPGSAL